MAIPESFGHEQTRLADAVRLGFSALRYTQALLSASPQVETHEWILGARRFHTKIVGEPAGGVSVQIETTLQ